MILQPWIQDYVVGIAEHFGADYFNAPRHPKWKTVQIIEILHRGPEGQESNVWARVSDSSRSITAKFTSRAAEEYLKVSQNKRLTQHQTAIIRIKDFKLFLGRVAVQEHKMTSNETIALECGNAKPEGSFDEKRMGNPQDITTHRDIKEWIEGLRKGGGEGNALRGRRIEREKQNLASNVTDKGSGSVPKQRKLDLVPKAPDKQDIRASSIGSFHPDPSKNHKPPWKPRMPSFYEIPSEILAVLGDLPIEGEEVCSSPNLRTDEAKELARSHKRRRLDDNNNKQGTMDIDAEVDERSSQPISDWSASDEDEPAAIPGQRRPLSPKQDTVPLRNLQKIDDTTSAVQNFPLPNSHKTTSSSPTLPPMSSYAKIEAPLSPSRPKTDLSVSQNPRSRVMRRVSPPRQPQEPIQSSGPERILVPASDTSMSQSQSQSQSQQRRVGSQVKGYSVCGQEEEGKERLQQAQAQAKQSSTWKGLPRWEVLDSREESKQQSHGTGNSERWDGEKLSEDDGEIDEQVFGDIGRAVKEVCRAREEKLRKDMGKRPPSKMGDKNSSGTSPNGHNPVSRWITALSEMDTLVQHEPGAWSQPSFMNRGVKLGGLEAGVEGMVKGELGAWMSWKELEGTLRDEID